MAITGRLSAVTAEVFYDLTERLAVYTDSSLHRPSSFREFPRRSGPHYVFTSIYQPLIQQPLTQRVRRKFLTVVLEQFCPVLLAGCDRPVVPLPPLGVPSTATTWYLVTRNKTR